MTQQTKRRRRKTKNPDASMSIMGHLLELRRRIIIAFLGLALGTIFGFVWYQHSINPIPTLGDIMIAPYCSLPPSARANFSDSEQCKLIATAPFDIFLLRVKVGAIAGLVLSSPIWLGQLWRFITPGLKKQEKKWTRIFVFTATLLFVLGAVLAYVMMFYGLELLLTIGDSTQIAALSGQQYFSFMLTVILIFGVSFELPLIIVMLNRAGVLKYSVLKDKRRIIILILFIFAAIATPAQDPFTMSALALSLCLMVEIALQIARIHDKRREQDQADWLKVDDEQSSPVDAPSPIPTSEKISTPQITTTFNTTEGDSFDDVL